MKNIFEFFYSMFILIFGAGTILSFLAVLLFFLRFYPFLTILLGWPVIAGIFHSLFKEHNDHYGKEINPSDSKKLLKIIKKIQTKTGIRIPHKIILSEGSEVGVTGIFEKKLLIGLATLHFLNEEDLEAIISHEYGHFSNKDTIFSYFTYRINHFIETQKKINFENISLDWSIIVHLPTFILFNILSYFFSIVTLWHSRRVEYRADEFASNIVGKQSFSNALVKFSVFSSIYEDSLPIYVTHLIENKKDPGNIYTFLRKIYSKECIAGYFKVNLSMKSNLLSTHPSISERLESLNIKSITIKKDFNKTQFIKNQRKYEKEASKLMINRILILKEIANMMYEDKLKE
jgi:hypothetical protein